MELKGGNWTKHITRLSLLVHLFISAIWSMEAANGTRQEILRQLLYRKRGNTSEYDHRVPPNFDEEIHTNVTVQIYILSFDSVTEAAMEFSVSVFLRQKWKDPRLAWWHPVIKDHLEVNAKMMGDIWAPDLYFVNEKMASIHEVTVSNKLLHLMPDGSVRYSIRISMTLSCDMHLDRYPHDEQTCSISLGSYSYSRENVIFLWDEDPIILRPGLTLPQFDVNFDNVSECNYFSSDESMSFGNFSCIQADFKLTREFGYYMAQVYLPSILIVILSWVSFWIDVDATPARVSLGLLTVLTMTTHSTGEKAALPRVSYVKAIDVWMSTCLFFVFAALLEFAYVNVQSRVAKRRTSSVIVADPKNRSRLNSQPDMSANVTDERPKNPERRFFTSKGNIERARLADKISRAAFPAAFIAFNIGYWVHYR